MIRNFDAIDIRPFAPPIGLAVSVVVVRLHCQHEGAGANSGEEKYAFGHFRRETAALTVAAPPASGLCARA